MYPEDMVAPMRKEAVAMGCKELRTAEQVKKALSGDKGTSLVFINSICGCAAGMARPGLAKALAQAKKKPNQVYTVFAGNDKEATDEVRRSLVGYPPSSPSIGLFKDGKPVAVVHRQDIEGHTTEQVAAQVSMLLDKFCA